MLALILIYYIYIQLICFLTCYSNPIKFYGPDINRKQHIFMCFLFYQTSFILTSCALVKQAKREIIESVTKYLIKVAILLTLLIYCFFRVLFMIDFEQ